MNGYNLRTPPWEGGGGQRSGALAERSGGGPHFCSAVRTPPPAAPGRAGADLGRDPSHLVQFALTFARADPPRRHPRATRSGQLTAH